LLPATAAVLHDAIALFSVDRSGAAELLAEVSAVADARLSIEGLARHQTVGADHVTFWWTMRHDLATTVGSGPRSCALAGNATDSFAVLEVGVDDDGVRCEQRLHYTNRFAVFPPAIAYAPHAMALAISTDTPAHRRGHWSRGHAEHDGQPLDLARR
jgi:hypothetical protein